jgi:glycosyltransferase involved in cell wall biosynthesis
MNYMAYGIPVIASVSPECETARIVLESSAGWVSDARNPSDFASTAAMRLRDPEALRSASRAGYVYARENFHPSAVAAKFESALIDVMATSRGS